MITGIWFGDVIGFFLELKPKHICFYKVVCALKKLYLKKKNNQTSKQTHTHTHTHTHRYKSLYLIMFLTLQSHNILSLIKT